MKTLLISLLLFITFIGCEHNLTSDSDINTKLNGRWEIVVDNKFNSKNFILTIKDGNWTIEKSFFKDINPFKIEEYNSNYLVTLINNKYETIVDSLGISKEVYYDTKLLLKINHNDTIYLSPLEPSTVNTMGIMKLIRKKKLS